MNTLARVTSAIFRYAILSEYIEIEDIARFEVAITNHHIRSSLQVITY